MRRAARDLDVTYPVAVDNDYVMWRAFGNNFWPALYFVDANGRIRHHQFGEDNYARSELILQTLLAQARHRPVRSGMIQVRATGAEAPASADVQSPETYLGYERAKGFASATLVVPDVPTRYDVRPLALSHWGLAGRWTVAAERAVADDVGDRIAYHFHARDLHLVMGAASAGRAVRFRVTLDGREPGSEHGSDTDASGFGSVSAQRLYQLLRQSGAVRDRVFSIQLLDPGVRVYSFTFG